MCGIAGIYCFDRAARPDPAAIATMVARLRHRGPDERGALVEPGCALGHARLSIIDLASGRQPLSNETGSVWTVFNGEIYNHLDLRAELEAAGHRFATRADTEAIVHLYEERFAPERERFFARLDGMFGIALWDCAAHRLLLARDPVGKKPVYWHADARRVAFASELKALLALPDVPRRVSLAAIDDYLALGYVPAPATIFEGVRKLPAGGFVACGPDGSVREGRFHDWGAGAELAGGPGAGVRDAEEAAARVRDLLERAVRRRLMSDVPLGAFLSGGVDSSAVVAFVARLAGRVKTFSIGFEEDAYDERADARRIATLFGTDHTELVVRPDALGVLDALVHHFDEPFADSSAVPCWYLAELTRRHVTVALSGDGGDEVFAGYARYVPDRRDRLFLRLPAALRRGALGRLARALPRGAPAKRYLGYIAAGPIDRYLTRVGIVPAVERAALYTDAARAALRGTGGALRDAARALAAPYLGSADERRASDFVARCARFDFATYLPEDILVKVDRTSMAHGLEARAPLLDRALAEFVFSLPPRLRAPGRPKDLLRRALEGRVLPTSVFEKRKHGFALPIDRWLRRELRDLVHDALLSPRAAARGIFQPAAVAAIVRHHEAGRNRAEQLWALLWLELWYRRFVDERTLAKTAT